MGQNDLSSPGHDAREQRRSKKTVSLAIPHERSSSISAQTMVTDSPEVETRNAPIKRRGTHVALVKLSWWDCFKAFLTGPKNLRRKLTVEVEWADPEYVSKKNFHERENPYMFPVSVYKQDSSEFIPAQCVLDTGNTQGNIISERLARRLGFTEYRDLTEAERNGGMVATGHIHQVSGAVRVSWFHKSSPKVFGRMRFLVSESEQIDLVIGMGSIVKENLLAPPNLGMNGKNFNELGEESDKERENRVSDIADLETAIKRIQKELAKQVEGTDEHKASKKSLRKKEKALQEANWKLELYDVNLLLQKKNTEKTERALRDKKKGLEAKLSNKDKKSKQS